MTKARADAGPRPEPRKPATLQAPKPEAARPSRDVPTISDDGPVGTSAEADIVALQRLAGNAAVASAVQRETPSRSDQPAKGMDIRAALQAQLPGLLAALSSDQVAQWQAYLDWGADQQRLRRAEEALASEYRWIGEGYYQHSPNYQAKLRRIESTATSKPVVTSTTVDPKLLLADDIWDLPEWDRDAEMAFRKWAVEQVTAKPREIAFTDPDRDQWTLHATGGLATYTKGVINDIALRSRFPDEYRAWVSERPLWKELRTVLTEMDEAISDSKMTHRLWLEANRTTEWWVVWISEALGEGSTDLPGEGAFAPVDRLVNQCRELLAGHKLELLAPIIEQAGQAAYRVITDVEAYDKRVTTGAQRAVKWAERLKMAGTIAAGVASGGLGLTGSALVAGGYQFVQSGAQQASEVGHGLRNKMDWSGLVTEAGVTALLAVVGGSLQMRFQGVWEARLASFGPTLGKRMAGMAAAGTSSFYQTGAEIAIRHFAQGQPFPASVDELSDMIIKGALENAGMDFALHPLNKRVTAEYEAWKAKRTPEPGPKEPTGPKEKTRSTPEPGAPKVGGKAPPAGQEAPVAPAKAEPSQPISPRSMPEDVVRSLLKSGGGWERLRIELEGGTGLGHGLSVPERRELIGRFEAHRQALGREVAGLFNGDVLMSAGPGGSSVEVRIGGPDASQRAANATAYLDARRPGWRQETALTIEPVAAPQVADPGAVKAQKALERSMDPQVRRIAVKMARHYGQLPAGQTARFDLLVAAVNDSVRAAGAPNIRIEATGRGPHFDAANWRLEVPADFALKGSPTALQFAEWCNTVAHEARHAVQMFEALRVATDVEAQGMMSTFRPDAFQAARGLGTAGNARVRALDPASLDFADARSYYESMWGRGAADRNALLMPGTGRMAVARTAHTDALVKEQQAIQRLYQLRNDPPRSLARRVAQRQFDNAVAERMAAEVESRRQYDAYRNLAEEIDAWAHGDAVQAEVLHYTQLRQALETAQVSEQTAQQALAAAREAFVADPNAGTAELKLYARALSQWRTISADVEKRARALAAIAGSGTRR